MNGIIIIIIITLITFSNVFHTNYSHENKEQPKHFEVLTEHCHLAKIIFLTSRNEKKKRINE